MVTWIDQLMDQKVDTIDTIYVFVVAEFDPRPSRIFIRKILIKFHFANYYSYWFDFILLFQLNISICKIKYDIIFFQFPLPKSSLLLRPDGILYL